VRRQRTLQRPREDHVVVDDILYSGSFDSFNQGIEGANDADSEWGYRPETKGGTELLGNSPGRGIVPPLLRSQRVNSIEMCNSYPSDSAVVPLRMRPR